MGSIARGVRHGIAPSMTRSMMAWDDVAFPIDFQPAMTTTAGPARSWTNMLLLLRDNVSGLRCGCVNSVRACGW